MTGLVGIPLLSREDANQRISAALATISGGEIIAVDTNSTGREVEVAAWLHPEDLGALILALERAARGDRSQTTIDLYGPPRYARSTTGRRD